MGTHVVNYFKKDGRGYQARMNAVLKAYVDAQLAKEDS
ncbi:MAG: BrnA antitoxin family protein [Caldilineaceae bacterium]|nr:BrnA antitoxin family protein [Caldilineaceae bacterium]